MPELNWQKSSFSGGPEGECIHVAAAPAPTILLRESDDPTTILTTTPTPLTHLLTAIRANHLPAPFPS